MYENYENTGVCKGASLESLPVSAYYGDCRLETSPDQHEKRGHMRVSPNPTSGTTVLTWQDQVVGSEVDLYDVNGLHKENFNLTGELVKTIDLSPFESGTYYLVWHIGNQLLDTKQVQLIKQ